ncbi:MAG: EamA family transporter [Gemmatimonadaceae bacterium]
MPESLPAAAPSRARVLAAYAVVYVVWGSTYLAINFAIATLPPFLMAGVRFLVAGLALYAWMRARGAVRPSAAQWKVATIIGAFLLLGGNGAVVWAEQFVPSGITALLVATVPLWMALLGWLGPDRRRPTTRVSLGLLVGMIGIVVLVGPGALIGQGGNVDLVGAAVLMFGSLAWAAGSLYARRAATPPSPQLGTAMQMLSGGLLLVVLGLATGEGRGLDAGAISATSMSALLYLIIFGSLVGFSAYVWLLRVEPPTRVSTYAYVNPVVAVGLGWLLAGEALTAQTLFAAAIIVGAVVLIVTTAKPAAGRTAAAALPPSATTTSRRRRRGATSA